MNVEPILLGLGRLSAQAAVLVLLVLLVQRSFGRQLTPRWRCALWLLPALRLVLPFSITSATSLYNLWPAPSLPPGAIRQSRAAQQMTPPTTERRVDHSVTRIAPPAPAASSVQSVPEPAAVAEPIAALPTAVRTQTQSARSGRNAWSTFVFILWAGVVLVLSLYVLCTTFHLARRFRRLPPVTDPTILALLEQCRHQLHLPSRPQLVESPTLPSPALHGLGRPCLILPRGLATALTPDQLRFVFLHELAHLKRHDILFNWLATFLQILHWFNPILWLGFSRWRADRELACDALALETAGEGSNRDYGRTILRLLEGVPRALGAPALVGILEDKRQLHHRLARIATFTPGGRGTWLALPLLVLLGLIALTDAQNDPSLDGPVRTKMLFDSQRVRRLVVTNGPTMEITVLDKATGRPLANAEVLSPHYDALFGNPSTQGSAPRWATGSNGTAVIQLGTNSGGVATTWFPISVRHPDYAPQGRMWRTTANDVRNKMPRHLTVELDKGITVGGTVLDENNQPLGKVRVCVYGHERRERLAEPRSSEEPEAYGAFWTEPPGGFATVTDEAGRWFLKHFPSSMTETTMEFARPDGGVRRFRFSMSRSRLQFLDLGSFDWPKFLERAGEFHLPAGQTISGMVLTPSGQPAVACLLKGRIGRGNDEIVQRFRTDSKGRFALRHQTTKKLLLTAYPEAFAISSLVAIAGQQNVVLRLEPQRPLTLRVVDKAEQPVSGVIVSANRYETTQYYLEEEHVTGPGGTVVWSNAPNGAFVLRISSFDDRLQRDVKVLPGVRDLKLVLSERMQQEIMVNGTARDAKTGKAIRIDRIGTETGASHESAIRTVKVDDTKFLYTISRSRFPPDMLGTYRLRIEADGYRTLTTRWRNFMEGDWSEEFILQPGPEPGGNLLTPEGKPAAHSEINWTSRVEDSISLNSPVNMYNPDVRNSNSEGKRSADADGHFDIIDPGIDGLVVITHPSGFLRTTIRALHDRPQLTLQPWGQVRGVFSVNGHPEPKAQLVLFSAYSSPNGQWHLLHVTFTEPDGSFSFQGIPPGPYLLYRTFNRPGEFRPSDQWPLDLAPGQSLEIDYSRTGRTIVGRMARKALWSDADPQLTLKITPDTNHPPVISDLGYDKDYETAYYRYLNRHRRQAALERSYNLRFPGDGSFRIYDVPAGTYELHIALQQPYAPDDLIIDGRRRPKERGSLTREVIVPETPFPRDAPPIDLGTLDLNWTEEPPPLYSAPVSAAEAVALPESKARDVARAIKLPEFRLEEVTLNEALKRLDEAGMSQDPKQRRVYFYLMVPQSDKTTASTKISLDLKNVSLAEAAEQICQQVGGFEWRTFSVGEKPALQMQPKEYIVSTTSSGDLGQSILRIIQEHGGRPKNTNGLAEIQCAWRQEVTTGAMFEGEEHVIVRITGNQFQQVTNFLAQALGQPTESAKMSEHGQLRGKYSGADIGGTLSFSQGRTETVLVLIGKLNR